MGSIRSFIDWLVLALCMATALILVFSAINVLESSAWVHASRGHAAVGVLVIVAAIATVKCGFLIGAGICKARRDGRLGAR